MKLIEIVKTLGLQELTVTKSLQADLEGAYASDLLSDVLANAPAGGVLITVQVHMNVIAVAVHAELAAVVFASGRLPDEAVIAKAEKEGVALYASDQTAFNVAGRLYELGLRGPDS